MLSFCDFFDDNIENYKEWCKSWFDEIKRVSNIQIFTPGNMNIWMWGEIEKPGETLIHYKKNSGSCTGHARFCKFEYILVYGKLKGWIFPSNVYDIPLWSGAKWEFDNIHPTVKEIRLYIELLKNVKPKNVLDIFMGSGTTAEACGRLSIPWFGYEINETYKEFIDCRIQRGAKHKSGVQTKLQT